MCVSYRVCIPKILRPAKALFAITVFVIASVSTVSAMDRAAAALRIAQDLGLPHSSDPKNLYSLFPGIFPGGYNGTVDVSLYREEATIENVVVALIRWTGWDTVHYDTQLIGTVTPYVTRTGFPYYAPDPTPRSIPYIIVALQNKLITNSDLPRLRSAVSDQEIDYLCRKAKELSMNRPIVPPLMLDDSGLNQLDSAKHNPQQVLILPTGFAHYDLLQNLPNRFLDLNAPSLRIFNSSCALSKGKQDYFPLGPLETQLSVGLHVGENSFSHQAESIYGEVENASTTVNAVGIWGSAASLRKNARVWGGFLVARTAEGPKNDAQVIGLEVDALNYALPGIAPNRSKVGIQVVGIGDHVLSEALEVIGAGPAKWLNGILVQRGAISPEGTVLGLAESNDLMRGIDFSHTNFKDSALLLKQGSRVTFNSVSGTPAMVYTDAFNKGHFVLRAGQSGLRIASNDDSKNLALFDDTGNIITPRGNFDQLLSDVTLLKKHAAANVPHTSSDTCSKGDIAETTNYVYVCVAPNRWRRAQLSDW